MTTRSAVQTERTRHILSLSGGKDSAALALYMRDRVSEMEYIFHDTDKELPETYDYLARLEAILGKPIVKSSSTDTFDHWLAVYGGMLPSNRRRWCTRQLKLKPFEEYVGDGPVVNYVGLRADEKRVGYISSKPNITAVYPFQEDGLVRADVIRISRILASDCHPIWPGVGRGQDASSASTSRRSNGFASLRPIPICSRGRANTKNEPSSTVNSSTGAKTKHSKSSHGPNAGDRSRRTGSPRRPAPGQDGKTCR